MIRTESILLADRHNKPIATDIHFDESEGSRPVIIYAHGFNGFKDWGCFNLAANHFVRKGFTLIKFNFAFNGTTPDTPEDFTDLEAFRENNYTKELDNLAAVIDWATAATNPYTAFVDAEKLGLCGHSMGGGVVLLKAAEDARVKAVTTWASVSECKTPWGTWPTSRIETWKQTGVEYIENGRTKQQMPLGYQLYEDYQNNKERLSIEKAVRSLEIPLLLIHGTADTSVPVDRAHSLKGWQPAAELFTLDTDHVFGRRHPWTEDSLPQPMLTALEKTIDFFSKALHAGK